MAWDFDGTSVTVEIAPDDVLWTELPTWVDITDYVRDIPTMTLSGRTNELEQAQPGVLEVVVDNRDRVFDLAYGPASVTFGGATGNYWSCPDDASFSGASALDVRFGYAADAWDGTSGVDCIAAQYGASGNRSWRVAIDASGYLQLLTSNNGTTLSTRDSGVRVSAVAGQTMACRILWTNAGAGTTTYQIKRSSPSRVVADCQSNDGWLTIGTSTGVTHTLYNSTDVIAVGATSDGFSTAKGAIYYVQAAVTENGSPEFVYWPKDAASTSATSWVSSETGETWSKNGTGSVVRIQGTYYGRLTPGTPIRVYATRSAVDYPLFYGYLRRVNQSYPSQGMNATATISATDSIGFLQDSLAPATPAQFAAGAASHFWGLHEGQNVADAADSIGTAPGQWSAPRQPGAITQTGAPNLATSLLNPGAYLIVPQVMEWDLADDGVALTAELYLDSLAATFRILFSDGTNTGGIVYGVGGSYLIQDPSAATAEVVLSRLAPGRHTLTYEAIAGTMVVTVDGAPLVTSGTTTLTSTTVGLYIDGTEATVSDVSLGTYLPATTGGIGQEGGAGQSTGERMVSLTNLSGVYVLTPELVDLTTDRTSFLGPTALGVSWWELMRQCVTVEQGRCYVAPDGKLTYRSRLWMWTATEATTSQATFGDSTGEVPYADLQIEPGDRNQVINAVTVTMPDGSSGQYVDTVSVAAYGRRAASFQAPCSSATDAANLARYIVGLRSHPTTRVTGLTLRPRGATTVWAEVLGRSIGDRITVKRRPTDTLSGGTPTEPIAVQVVIERISHRIMRDGTWTTTLLTAPPPPTAAEGGYWTVGDAVLGLIGNGMVTIPY